MMFVIKKKNYLNIKINFKLNIIIVKKKNLKNY